MEIKKEKKYLNFFINNNTYNFFFLYNYLQMDNDDQILKHNYYNLLILYFISTYNEMPFKVYKFRMYHKNVNPKILINNNLFQLLIIFIF